MYAVGFCWRSGEWVFSIYKCGGEALPTLKVRRVERVRAEVQNQDLKTPLREVVENVR